MEAIKGIYENGKIKIKQKPLFLDPVEVLIIFPEKKKKPQQIGGLFKDINLDYDKIEKDLKKLGENSAKHLMKEAREN